MNPDRYWWIEFSKVLFGFVLAFSLIFLAYHISVGEVHEDTSAGQKEIIGTLKDVLMVWAAWCFRSIMKSDDKEK